MPTTLEGTMEARLVKQVSYLSLWQMKYLNKAEWLLAVSGCEGKEGRGGGSMRYGE